MNSVYYIHSQCYILTAVYASIGYFLHLKYNYLFCKTIDRALYFAKSISLSVLQIPSSPGNNELAVMFI